MKKNLLMLIVVVLFFGCAGNSSITASMKKKEATPEMREEIFKNLEIGKKLAAYDKAAWVASDLFNAKVTDRSNMESFYVLDNKVYFGGKKDGKYLAYCSVDYSDGKASNFQQHDEPIENEVLTRFSKATGKSTELNSELILSRGIRHNYYAFEDTERVTIWWIPAMTNEIDALCGGIRTTFDKATMELIENKKLHQSVLTIAWKDIPKDLAFRTHTILSNIPNEVDFAHFIIKQDMFSEHVIYSPDYNFYLNIKNDPIIEFYGSSQVAEKSKVIGTVFKVETDETGAAIKVTFVSATGPDSKKYKPSDEFLKTCNYILSASAWEAKAGYFFYNFYYDTVDPDRPMIYSEKQNKFIPMTND